MQIRYLQVLTILLFFLFNTDVKAQYTLHQDLQLQPLMTVPGTPLKLSYDKWKDKLYYLNKEGELYEINTSTPGYFMLSGKNEHHISNEVTGISAFNGTVFLSGNVGIGSTISGVIKKAIISSNPLSWKTVVLTESLNGTNSGIGFVKTDPEGQKIFFGITARTQSGEQVSGSGESSLTANIYSIQTNSDSTYLTDVSTIISPFIYAKGIKKSNDIGWDYKGNLFGLDISGNGYPDEINLLKKGNHYGFPWKIGVLPNPETDVNPPALTLIDPLSNIGPHADFIGGFYNIPVTDASLNGVMATTISPYAETQAIEFDFSRKMGGFYADKGFLLFKGDNPLHAPYEGDSTMGALSMVIMDGENGNLSIQTIIKGFQSPVDMEIVDNQIFLIEGSTGKLWKVTFPERRYDAPKLKNTITIDGLADESEWNKAPWAPLDYLWMDLVSANQNTPPAPADFSGRYKALWKDTKIYILAEITDDVDDGNKYGDYPLNKYADHDCLEVFIDPDMSGGPHERSNQAFALHISTQNFTIDLRGDGVTSWSPDPARVFYGIVNSKVVRKGTLNTWEVELTLYNRYFDELQSDNSEALVTLTSGSMVGFSLAYNDSDGGIKRRFMMGSNKMEGTTNDARNQGWLNADVFGKMKMIDEGIIHPPYFNLNYSVIGFSGLRDSILQVKIMDFNSDENTIYKIRNLQNSITGVALNTATGMITLSYHGGTEGNFILTVTAINQNFATNKFINITADQTVTPTGIVVDLLEDAEIEVYPNPASTEILLEGKIPIKEIKIMDLQGKILVTRNELKVSKLTVPTSQFPKGVYILMVKNILGGIKVKRVLFH